MNSVAELDVMAGQAVYSKSTLAIYDLLVLGLSNRFIWRCPTPRLLEHYDEHVSDNHLDVGVGTGYFLDRCRYPVGIPRISLVDLNAESLGATAHRVRRYRPSVYKRNVLAPLELGEQRYDSVAMNYLLHCIPGDMRSKAAAFDHVLPYMNDGATLFGSTLLQGGVRRNAVARRLMRVYNSKGIFANVHDDLDVLKQELAKRFSESGVTVIGCAALFWARNH